ncbi:hypothetical protein GCM10022403_053350 [Streptomyces coacervatus]|uniref:Uncharacterized protein n=1 Tax=Streptomyces coacervatus TaxID=647381 RepID=A0ABP7I9T4_9ACTN
MADARPGARIVHIARLDPMRYGAAFRVLCCRLRRPVNPIRAIFKHPGDVILPSIAFGCLRARLAASCSLVSLAVQSLRSM